MTIHSTRSQCNKVCETEAQLEQHKKTHSEGVTCDVCKKKINTKQGMQEHRSHVHVKIIIRDMSA